MRYKLKIIISLIIVSYLIWMGFLFNRSFEIKFYLPKIEKRGSAVIAPEVSLSPEEIKVARAYLTLKKIKSQTIPTGSPEVYGENLGISFDKVQDAINKVAPLDPAYGKQKITLVGSDLERYIKIGELTSCKYCCGVRTLVLGNGAAACSCEHSQMMRGLSAYLIKNTQLSNEKIFEELNRWRATFFPRQTLQEVLAERERAGEEGIRELLEVLPQMVGGC